MGWDFARRLSDLEATNSLRTLHRIDSPQGPWVVREGRRRLLLASNDYLGLANHPKVREAAIRAIHKFGVGAAASRLISGSMPPHHLLEERVAAFKGTEAALLFNSGYSANLAILPCLAGRGDRIFLDRLCHASLIDGARQSGATVRVFRHRDTAQLEPLLRRGRGGALVVTDGVFSMDGDLAPLSELARITSGAGVLLVVDDAHGNGVIGKLGRGAAELLGVEASIPVQIGTFGKAFGTFGAFVAGKRDLIRYLINRARPFLFTTALPPAIAAATLTALDLIESSPELRERLAENQGLLRRGLQQIGFEIPNGDTPIIPLHAGTNLRALQLSDALLRKDILAPAIRPPAVPEGTARLRLTVSAAHSSADLNWAIDRFHEAGKELGWL